MSIIRRSFLAFAVTLVAAVAGAGTALAGPPPLIEPEQSGSTGGGSTSSSSSDGFLDGWPQVTLAILIGLAVVAAVGFALSRMRHHHQPTAA